MKSLRDRCLKAQAASLVPLCVLCGKENVLCKLIWRLVCARALEGTGREINRSATGLDAHVRFHLDLVALFF